jgi:ADP-ribose pyrophosphatase YjhB (NUDIX family)
MSSPAASAGRPVADWAARRVEIYSVLAGADGRPVTLVTGGSAPGSPDSRRVPGVILGHGEHPRDAAGRAASVGGVRIDPHLLHLRRVLSDVRPVRGPVAPVNAGFGGDQGRSDRSRHDRPDAHPGLHVLRLVFEADRGLPLPIDDALLREPDPAVAPEPVPFGPPMVQRPAAYALVVRDDRVLLSRLAGHGPWTLPGGGIDHGEHPDDAVRRETFEETGLRLTRIQLADVDSRHFTGQSPDRVTENFHGVRILYRGEVAARDEPVVQEVDGSTEAAAWVPSAELERLHLADLVRVALARLR